MATGGHGMSACCLSGSIHEGSPVGHEDKIGGLDTYISEPSDKSKAKTVVFLTDVFGWKFKNVRLLADNYAKAGFYCYIPDLHKGDSLDIALLQSIEPSAKDKEEQSILGKAKSTVDVMATLGPWIARHTEGVTAPVISDFLKAVRAVPGTGKIGTVGFCWGGRYAILQAHADGEADAAYAAHPSLTAIPGDYEPVTKPLSIAVGDKDSYLDNDSNLKIRDILNKAGAQNEVVIYEDQIHGFALRSDWSYDKDKKAMDDAEKQGISWFKKYLS